MSGPRRPVTPERIPAPRSGHLRVAIVGGATLRGRELKDVLEERNFPAASVTLLDDDESLGQLDAVGDEPTFIQAVTAESFENVDLVFFASLPAFTRSHAGFAQQAGCAVVDLSGALEGAIGTEVRSPWLDREQEDRMEVAPIMDLKTTALVSAHPAAVMLALILGRLQRVTTLRHAAATVFEPVSEQGKRGMDELHQQTLNLLSFQPMQEEFFDVQVAFNMVPRYGEDSKLSIGDTAERILRHLRTITRGRLAPPALQLIQAPTFHGNNIALYVEIEAPSGRRISAEDLGLALAGEHVEIVPADEDPPSNVRASGQDEILIALRADASQSSGFWLWLSADNLRLAAMNAVECGLALAASRPSGKVQ